MKKVTMYTVMIASPSDVQAERKATEDVIRKYNAEVRFSKSQHRLETGRWELDTALGAAEDAQDLIDEDITDTVDLVVGIFFTKLGTASSKDASYTIGELKRCIEAGKPVLILFNDDNIPRTANYEEVSRVDDFRKNPKKYLGKSVLYATYKGVNEFREVFRNEITKVMNKILKNTPSESKTYQDTLTDLKSLVSQVDGLLAKEVTSNTQQFILWKNLVEDYLRKAYGEDSTVWTVYSQISFGNGCFSLKAEADECHNGLCAAKIFLSQLLSNSSI